MNPYMNLYIEKEGELNINCKSTDLRGRLLSNLTNRPFEIDGQMCASVEAFFAGILFPFDDPRRKRSFASCYNYAQQMVQEAGKFGAWWNGIKVDYGSKEHKEWVKRALLESTLQNPDRYKALMDTKGLKLVHETGTYEDPNSFLSRKEFCEMMTNIRDSLSPSQN